MAAPHPADVDGGHQKSAPPAVHETGLNPLRATSATPADKADQAGSSDRHLAWGLNIAEATTATMGPKTCLAKRGNMLTLRPRILTGSRVSCIKEEIPVRAMILPDGQVFVSPQVQSDTSGDKGAASVEWVRKLRGDASAALKHKRYCFFDMSAATVGGPAPKPWGEVKLSKAIRRTPPGDKGLLIRGSSGRMYGRTGDRFSSPPPASTSEDTNGRAKDTTPQEGGLQGIHVAHFIFPVRAVSDPPSPGQTQPSSTTATGTAEQAYATESCIITFDLQNLDTIPPAIRREVMRNIEKHMSDTVTRILTHKFAALHTEWRRSNGEAEQSDTDKAGTDDAIVGDDGEAVEPGKKYRCLLAVAKGSLYFESEACAYLSGVKALGADGKVAELSALVDDLRIRQTKVAGGSAGIDKDGKKKDAEQARMLRYECAGTITRWRGKTIDET